MRRSSYMLAAALLAGAACGEGRRGGGDWLAAREAPVALRPTLEQGAAVSKTVSAVNGATLTATGADGTRYRLKVPAGALLSDAVITIVPVTTLDGLPLRGGSVAAVQIEPSGLQLLKPATLTIRPAREVPVAEQVAFGWYGAGDDAHRYPLSPDPRRVEMQLVHFSGYGFGRASADDPGRAALQRAHDLEARLRSRVAEIIDRERVAEERGEEGTFAEVNAAFIEYYDTVLRPLMKTAETDDRMADCASERYLGWERDLQLLGSDGADDANDAAPGARTARAPRPDPDAVKRAAELKRRRDEGHTSWLTILDNQYAKGKDRALEQCRKYHDLSSAIRLLVLERQMQLLGGSAGGGFTPTLQAMKEVLGSCLSFDLEFDSRFDNRVPGGRLLHHVQAKLSVDAGKDRPAAGPIAQAPTTYVEHVTDMTNAMLRGADGSHNLMSALILSAKDAGTTPGTFSVHAIDWDRNPVQLEGTDCSGKDTPGKKDATPDSLTVLFQAGQPADITRATYRFSPPANLTSHTWADFWSQAHGDAQVAELQSRDDPERVDPVYRVTLHKVEPGVWRAEFARSSPGSPGGASLVEQGHLILRHAPK